jgi:hypothetical protein
MTSQKTKLTNKKFYGKWLYKVSLHLNGCAIFRQKTLDYIKSFCQGAYPEDRPYSLLAKAYKEKENIMTLANFLESYDSKLWSKRIESSRIDFYTNDIGFYNKLSIDFKDILIHRFEPDPTSIDQLNVSPSTVVVKKLPHNKYQYRAYLLPHKMAGDKEGKQKYINWLKTQEDRITCTPAVEKWFMTTEWNWDRRYILVEDESTLLMLKLRNSEVVGRIYNYVVSDK